MPTMASQVFARGFFSIDARSFHELAEQGAEEKDREELHYEPSGTPHEGLCPMGQEGFSRQARCEDRRRGSEQKYAPAPIRQPDEES